MAALALVSDLETRLGVSPGSLAGPDLARASATLDDVSALVIAEGDATWTSVTVPATVKVIALRAAVRAYRNPEGFVSESLGDYSFRLADGEQTGLYLTDAERDLIRRAAGIAGEGLWSVGTPSPFETPAVPTVADPALNGPWEV